MTEQHEGSTPSQATLFQHWFEHVLRERPETAQRAREKRQRSLPEELQEANAGIEDTVLELWVKQPWALVIVPDRDRYRLLELYPTALEHTIVRLSDRDESLDAIALKHGLAMKDMHLTEKAIHTRLKHRRRVETEPSYRQRFIASATSFFQGMFNAMSRDDSQEWDTSGSD